VHMGAAHPRLLTAALAAQHERLRDVEVVHLHVEGELDYLKHPESFRHNALFIGSNARDAVSKGLADFTPIFFSEIPLLFRRMRMPLQVALINVSPPDVHGFCSLGVSVDCSLAAVEMAKRVVAQVNPCMPRTHGDGVIHISAIDGFIECAEPLAEHHRPELSAIEKKIGHHIATLIPDGATLQMGIGNIPDAALAQLSNHRNLGIHTEMFSDGVIDLIECGAVNNLNKKKHWARSVSTFLVGTKRVYDFVNDNPSVNLLDVQYVNNPNYIAQNPSVCAINSAIEVDLTGQVCADSIGKKMFSGVGGQMDFIRGASMSEGGKPIIALPSTTRSGASRIVAALKEGAGVVTTRAHVHYVVTEYGVAQLFGRNLRQRADALCMIAHPDHREALLREARERFGRAPGC
jgi:4-hydroxybutyrate CoA-transferase